jgi:hypothetical protein
MTETNRTYSELIKLLTFKERFRYLQLSGIVGRSTFGFDRYINQRFYTSKEWQRIRDFIIIRDLACDLGVEGYEILSKPVVHHMNPISFQDISKVSDILLNPQFLICTTQGTHNAIHYGDENLLEVELPKRFSNDTCPWKNEQRGLSCGQHLNINQENARHNRGMYGL